MTTQAFKELINTLTPNDSKTSIRHADILDTAREVIRSPLFGICENLAVMSSEETRIETKALGLGSDNLPYPIGIYSFDDLEEKQIRRYIFILLVSDTQHVYVKLMLNDADLSLDYHRIALVQMDEKSTLHLNMTNERFDEVLNQLQINGVTL